MAEGMDPRRRAGRSHDEIRTSPFGQRPQRGPQPHRRVDSGPVPRKVSRPRPQQRPSRRSTSPAASRPDRGRATTRRVTPDRAPAPGGRGEVRARGGVDPTALLGRVPWTVVAGALVVIALVFGLVSCVRGCSGGSGEKPAASAAATTRAATDQDFTLVDEGRTTKTGDGKVTFCAVGDNLMNSNLLELCDGFSGTAGDKQYDFKPLYAKIKPTIKKYDIAFVNQETVMGGTDNFDYSGYPSYNTPDSMVDALEDTGFRLVNTNSNHTYDIWVDAIEHQHELFAQHPKMLTAGSYASEKDRQTPRVIECNGIRIAFLSYGYGQNGYEQSDLPNDYYAVPYTKDGMKADVERARKVSDFVLVYMHWGTEYSNDVDDTQREFAQYAADLGVGMVIGSHVHVIQPMEWVTRAEGSSSLAGSDGPNAGKMLVAYGLGDFVSGYHNYPDTIMSGMLSCTLKREGTGKKSTVAVKDVVWHPLIEHWADGKDVVMPYKDYTKDLAEKNELLATLDDPYGWISQKTRQVIGDDFKIDM